MPAKADPQIQALEHFILCQQPNDLDGSPVDTSSCGSRGGTAASAPSLYIAAFANGKKEWFVFQRYQVRMYQ